MENSSTRLVVYVTLLTLGVVLMLLGISWLMFLGVALIMLGTFFSSQKSGSRSLAAFLIFAGVAVVFLIVDLRDGVAFAQKTRPLLFWITMIGVWIWGVIEEFRKSHKGRISQMPNSRSDGEVKL